MLLRCAIPEQELLHALLITTFTQNLRTGREIANSEWELVTRPTAGDPLSTAMTSRQSREFGCANSSSRECSDATFGPIYKEH